MPTPVQKFGAGEAQNYLIRHINPTSHMLWLPVSCQIYMLRRCSGSGRGEVADSHLLRLYLLSFIFLSAAAITITGKALLKIASVACPPHIAMYHSMVLSAMLIIIWWPGQENNDQQGNKQSIQETNQTITP